MMLHTHEEVDFRDKSLQEELACERLSHIATILDYRYGIDAKPGIDSANGEYSVWVWDEDRVHLLYTYDIEDMVDGNVEEEANHLWGLWFHRDKKPTLVQS